MPKTLQFLSVRQTAEILNICYLTAFRKISKKEIPSIRIGRKILVPISFLTELEERSRSYASAAEV
jgi:excisionase family DNA binding protein